MFSGVVCRREGEAEAVVLGIFEEKIVSAEDSPLFSNTTVLKALERKECTGETDNLVETFITEGERAIRVYLLGFGKQDKFKQETLRKVAATLGRRLAQTKDSSVRLELSSTLRLAGVDVAQSGRSFGESIGLLAWKGKLYPGSAGKEKDRAKLDLITADSDFAAGMESGLSLAVSTNLAREVSQTPPNVATPFWIAEQAQKMAQDPGVGKPLQKHLFMIAL